MKQLHPRAIWMFFIRPFSVEVLSLLVVVYIYLDIKSKLGEVSEELGALLGMFLWIILIILLAEIVVTYLWAKLAYRNYRYELSESAFKKEFGVIWKRYVSIPYDRIQNVDISRGPVARVLGLSTLLIQTAGMSGVATWEGQLPGLLREEAEKLREELINRVRSRNQGL